MIKKSNPLSLLLATVLLLSASLIGSQPLKAQDQKDYSLLYEITGNGLNKPSYIFGSISLNDPRAFNFSDSVYIGIANTSLFALETHPDTVAKYLRDLQKLAKNTATQNPLAAEMKGSENTIPSYFLYGIARTLKKKYDGLGGDLEETEDHLLSEDPEDEHNEDLETLLKLYAKGNLNNIYGEIQQYFADDYFEERSAKLTSSIINLLKKETLFASVAVALLPGEHSILAKLKKAGYQVRPVNATFTGYAKTYQIDFEKMDWQKYTDDAFHFSVKFPSSPNINNQAKQAKIVTYKDPINFFSYTASALYTGPLSNSVVTPTQYVDTVLARYINNIGAKIISSKKYQRWGSTALEAALETKETFLRSILVHVNGTFYSFTIESKSPILNEPLVDLYFNAIEISEPKNITLNDWVEYKSEEGGFSSKLPYNPQYVKKEVNEGENANHPYHLNMYQSADKNSLFNYIIRYNDFPDGMYLADKNKLFDILIDDMSSKGEVVVKPTKIIENGIEGRSLDLIAAQSYMQTKLFIKGNRTYIIVKQNMNGPVKPKEDTFFNNFRIKLNLNPKSVPFVIGNFTINTPESPQLIAKSAEDIEEQKKGESFLYDEQSYYATNKYTGGLYGIEKSTISKYYKHKNGDSLLYTLANKISGNGKIKEIVLNNSKVLEYITTDSLGGTTKKSRIWFDGNNCYLQTLIADKDEIESPIAEAFFRAIKSTKTQSLFNFQASKAKLIVDDLASLHQPTKQLALGAISFYNFDKEELPQIYTALKQKYTDDTTTTGTRYILLNELENLNDEETIPFLKNLYTESKDLDLIRSKILSTAPYVDAKSYDWYFKALTEAPVFDIENHWELFNPLRDSLTFVATNLDKVLKIGEEKAYRPMVLSLLSSMLNNDSTYVFTPKIEANNAYLKKHAIKDLDEDIELIKQNIYTKTTNYYLAILTKLNLLTLTDEYTKKAIALDSVPYIKTNALAVRIRKNLPIEQNLINSQLDSLQSRYTIMRAYHDAGKIDKVPMKYREHSEFAKLLLSDFLSEEYDYPLAINLLGEVKEKEKTYYAFSFIYEEEGEKKTYIGIAGSFDDEKNVLKFGTYGAYSDFDLIEKDWMKQAKSLIQTFNNEE